MIGVECPQGHRYQISEEAIEVEAGREAYECPECEHMVDANNAGSRFRRNKDDKGGSA